MSDPISDPRRYETLEAYYTHKLELDEANRRLAKIGAPLIDPIRDPHPRKPNRARLPTQRDKSGKFAKGSSGNYGGRPVKDEKAFTPGQHASDFIEAALEPVQLIAQDGTSRSVSRQRAIIQAVLQRAMKGEPGALKEYLLLQKAVTEFSFATRKDSHDYLRRFKADHDEEAVKKLTNEQRRFVNMHRKRTRDL